MGNHATHPGPEKRGKDVPSSIARMDGQPINIDKGPNTSGIVLKTQPSSEEHDLQAPLSPGIEESSEVLSGKKFLPLVVRWNGDGKDVYVVGNFEQGRIPMNKSEKDFVGILNLPLGHYDYHFEVDGEEKCNNVDEVHVREDGKEVHQIRVDEDMISHLETELLGSACMDHLGEGYGQVVPEYKPTDRIKDPPVLPPHLLQVILNKDTPVSCEPTLLPEPNHVIVNHMYALSIRDGMMVLSTTHRYKKKSVTTLIYRPI